MKTIAPIIMLTLFSLIIPQQSVAASQAKAGAKCKKANSTQTVGGKKFTCIKSGSKLVWNRGSNVARPVVPIPSPIQPSPEPSPQAPSAPTTITRQIFGVQNAIAKVHYVNNLPRAKRIIRWPNQNDFGRPEKIVIVYENMRREAPPCDLSQALCQGPTRVDTKVYFKAINDGSTEVFTLEDLQLDSEYNFGVYAVIGEVSESEILRLARPQFFLAQSSGLVPDAPTGITVGTTPGNLKITSSAPIEDGYKLLILVIGGKFGTSTTVATLTAPQEILVPAPNGYYQITSRMVSPSGINGNPGQLFEVTVT